MEVEYSVMFKLNVQNKFIHHYYKVDHELPDDLKMKRLCSPEVPQQVTQKCDFDTAIANNAGRHLRS